MIPPIILTIPPESRSAEITFPNGDAGGRATFDPPTYPHAPLPVTCDLPCLGKIYLIPQLNNPTETWICNREVFTTRRDEGEWSVQGTIGGTSTGERVETWLTLPLTMYLPNDLPAGSHFWTLNDHHWDIPLMFDGTYYVNAVLSSGYYYRDSLGTNLTPCDALRMSYAEWNSTWSAIYQRRFENAGEPGWDSSVYFEWGFSKIENTIPQTGNLLPIYAGCLNLLGLMGGGGNSSNAGGAIGLMAMAGAAAGLVGLSSAAASAGGRVPKSSDKEDSAEYYDKM